MQVGAYNKISKLIKSIDHSSKIQEIIDKIVKDIIVEERKVDIVSMQKKNSYFSINKKHVGSSILLPGKKYERGGVTKKFNKTGVVFVDVSWSTDSTIKNFSGITYKDVIQEAARQLQEKYGLQTIYYDTGIVDIIKDSDKFHYLEPCGATDIRDSFKEYLEREDINSVERLYVISDGQDHYEDLFTIYYKEGIIQNTPQVYIIENSFIYDTKSC